MKYLAYSVMCMLPLCGLAQDSTWVPVTYPAANCSWLMPGQPNLLDTLHVRMYSLEMDSTKSIAIHFVLEVLPDTSDGSLFDSAMAVEQDSLRAMAQVLLYVSGADLQAINDTSVGDVPALDMTYATPAASDPKGQVTRLRLIYHDRRFMTFAASAPKNRSTEVIALANAMCGTIQFDQP